MVNSLPSGASRSRGLGRAALFALVVTISGCSAAGTESASDSQAESTIPTTSPDAVSSPSSASDTNEGDAGQPAGTVEMAEMGADDIPVAHTPPGGWTEMPPPVLANCTDALVADAIDMRGSWKVVRVVVNGLDDPQHKVMGEEQRIEQCGNRVIITSGGIIHDMRADGTEEGGVHDVAGADKTTPITVIATFENGVHVLRPVGLPVEIRRRVEGQQLVWEYAGFTAHLDRVKA